MRNLMTLSLLIPKHLMLQARPWLEERGFSLWVDRDYGVGEEVKSFELSLRDIFTMSSVGDTRLFSLHRG